MMKKWRALFGASAPDSATPPDLPFDPLDPGFLADPGPVYAGLRAHAPVAPLVSGGVLLTRHADILAALTHPGLGNAPSRFSPLAARNAGRHAAAALAAHIPPFLDKPEHITARRALSAAFHEVFEGAEDWIVAAATDRVAAARGQELDLIADLARPFAGHVMARFTGVPDDTGWIKQTTDAFFHLFAPIPDRAAFAQVNDRLQEARAHIARHVAARTGTPRHDLMSRLLHHGMSVAQAADNTLLVLADGIENIEAGIATALDLSLRHADAIPDGADPQAVARECLRLASPGQIIPRVAREDCSVAGHAVKAGGPVFLALGSANLDPDAHTDPNSFRLDRMGETPLVFGRGRHSCIGAALGVAQVSSMLDALRKAGARRSDTAAIRYHRRFGHRWPVAMPVRIP